MDSPHEVQALTAVNESNVIAAIEKLKNNYICRLDAWSHFHVLKSLQYVIVTPITIIYNQLFSVAYVPIEWKKAAITPIHKKGPTTTCSNYRPIQCLKWSKKEAGSLQQSEVECPLLEFLNLFLI